MNANTIILVVVILVALIDLDMKIRQLITLIGAQ